MKECQRWQPEEDAILKAYVKQYGPNEWNLISQRMPKPLHRDPKSCLERWKNYLKPGIKKGSLTPEEQSLVISLQAKYGNKWNKIANEVPGRTSKRLGKWWEVFKEKQLKQLQKTHHHHQQHNHNQNHKKFNEYSSSTAAAVEGNIPSPSMETVAQGRYDHILENFAEKYVQPKLYNAYVGQTNLNLGPNRNPNLNPIAPCCSMGLPYPDPILSLGSGWMGQAEMGTSTSSSSSTSTPSPSASLILSQSDPEMTRFMPGPSQAMGTLLQYCKQVEEGRQSWLQHKKEATWRLSRLEQQLESEKGRKRKEKVEEIEGKILCLREEEMAFVGRIESEYKEQLVSLQGDAERKEGMLIKAWYSKHAKLAKLVEQIGIHSGFNIARPN